MQPLKNVGSAQRLCEFLGSLPVHRFCDGRRDDVPPLAPGEVTLHEHMSIEKKKGNNSNEMDMLCLK
jgi:hypothetical protein